LWELFLHAIAFPLDMGANELHHSSFIVIVIVIGGRWKVGGGMSWNTYSLFPPKFRPGSSRQNFATQVRHTASSRQNFAT
jgi:hypothetical protein